MASNHLQGQLAPSDQSSDSSTVVMPGNKARSSLPGQTHQPKRRATPFAIFLGGIASIGGFVFGYESGQISGFLQMSDFLQRFGQRNATEQEIFYFSPARQGTIVALLSAGTLVGCLGSGWICDTIGRRFTISAAAFFYIIGVIIEITSSTVWPQFAMGRFVAGLGIGALSVAVPMYQSESVPKNIRASVTSSYQLLITLGIWIAYMVNWGTESTYRNSAQWRIPNGLSALWAIILGGGILFMPESPRFAYRRGKTEAARKTLARLHGVAADSPLVEEEIAEIQAQITEEEKLEKAKWIECFMVKDRMLYRTLLGMILQAGQQLTGANFFFYYGTTIFKSVGLSNSYVTSIILGTVNVVATIVSVAVVNRIGRRKPMIIGALWMFMCFMVYSFVGSLVLRKDEDNGPAGAVLIVFTCLFICAFATTWGPLVWTIVAELYPPRYRAQCMALATSSNWLFNFLISFFTIFITDKIHYWYGMVFGGSCLILAFIVYFFVMETKDRSLELIDYMYVNHVNPITSASWNEGDAVPGHKQEVKKDEASAPPMLAHEEEQSPATV
ncbi:Hexose transporter 2 [Hyphodiscus hymeniophilus]|uniref:Hexose transporter 2 n=1 Tax=Hyphodiscus hymeniophilus TaxID=353542 RepID=A0A9P6VQW3_9HELO|nr:Hexose transporter 2 [Hyphodiscus hymeniophilus]